MAESNSTADFACSICSVSFSNKYNFTRHQKKFHVVQIEKEVPVPIEKEEHTFYSVDEFKSWKHDIEKRTCSKFIQLTGVQKDASGSEVTYYNCHRSGHYKPLQDRKRHLKIKGSVKIGKICPAKMKTVKVSDSGAVEIRLTFVPRHEGHNKDPGTLTLSTPEKSLLAGQIAQGVNRKRILTNLESTFSPTKRLSLTKMKDLTNIAASYKLDCSFKLDKDDAVSVDLTVKKLRKESDNPVLIYKPQGTILEDMPQFGRDDFLLGLMNDAQLGLLTLYGNTIIQIDSTHGTNMYDIQLTTVMVNDANQEGFPVAVLFSNRQTTDVYATLFQEIKDRLSQVNFIISPKVFMSDDAPAFYNAWKDVFGQCPNQLICTWHVERSFNINLQKKILDPATRERVSKELKALHHETDQCTFEVLLSSMSEDWTSKAETKAFAEYFSEYYRNRPEQWAYCYRQWLGINTNMKLERWHKEIKYDGGEGKVMKRLDKALSIVTNAVNRKLISRVVHINRPKITAKIQGLRKRHKRSVEMPNTGIIEMDEHKMWVVPSSKQDEIFLEMYEVKKLCDGCMYSCDVRCDFCNACIHQYSCSCLDNTIRLQMCKHIHKICTLFPVLVADVSVNDKDVPNLIIDTNARKEHEGQEVEAISKELSKRVNYSSLGNKRNSCLSLLQAAIANLASMTTHEQLDMVEKNASKLLSEMDIRKTQAVLPPKIPESAKPVNTKIAPQRTVKLLRKRRPKKKCATENEPNRVVISTLLNKSCV